MKQSQPRHLPLLRHDFELTKRVGWNSLAGVDEAGRGPLAGPVVASAVVVRDFSFLSRIDDSKKLTEKARERAFEEILEKCAVGVGVIDHETIDRVNILEATMLAMKEALRNLPFRPDRILVDGARGPQTNLPVRGIISGDAISFSIACASIVAKVTRDRLMDRYHESYPEYGFCEHKGYGTRRHLSALQKHGPSPIHRKSFEPVKSLHGNTPYN